MHVTGGDKVVCDSDNESKAAKVEEDGENFSVSGERKFLTPFVLNKT